MIKNNNNYNLLSTTKNLVLFTLCIIYNSVILRNSYLNKEQFVIDPEREYLNICKVSSFLQVQVSGKSLYIIVVGIDNAGINLRPGRMMAC